MTDSAVKVAPAPLGDEEPITTEPLSEMEDLFLDQKGINTITFFTGTIDDAKKCILERLQAVVEANPWLCGRLVKKKGMKTVAIQFSRVAPKDAAQTLLYVSPPAGARYGVKWRQLMCCICKSQMEVPSGTKLVNKDLSFCAVSLIPDRLDANAFGFVLSISHAVVDGSAYYAIYNMLGGSEPVRKLNVTRKPNWDKAMRAVISDEAANYLFSSRMKWNCILTAMRGRKVHCSVLSVDPALITKGKEAAVKEGKVPYVSTNDILTSGWFNMIEARTGQMAIDLRNRAEGFDNDDAGNTEAAVILNAGDWDTPTLIRQALSSPPYVRAGTGAGSGGKTKIPSGFGALTCRMGLITNWATNCKQFSIDKCTHRLHLPVPDMTYLPLELCVVFAPRDGELASLLFTTGVNMDTMPQAKSNKHPWGEPLEGVVQDLS